MVLDGQFSRAEKVSVPAIVETTALSNDDWPPGIAGSVNRIVSSPPTRSNNKCADADETSKGFPLVSRDAGLAQHFGQEVGANVTPVGDSGS